ncbi:MAG: hypothetical protein SWX82_13160 [Cyanobacteriota bacterium]|nr:hypothetical protein [Cyanobacteriota bacterium]
MIQIEVRNVDFNSSFLEGQETWATYRYVQTAGYQLETEKERLIFGGYGMNLTGERGSSTKV